MKKLEIITDLIDTLIIQEPLYDEVLKDASDKYLGGSVLMKMDLGVNGNPFPVHIRTILENESIAERVRPYLGGKSPAEFARRMIDEFIREQLVNGFSRTKSRTVQKLEDFIDFIETTKTPSGIVTGDLRPIAETMLRNNDYKDLQPYFLCMTCGDDPGSYSRIDQITSIKNKMQGAGANGEFTYFVDDSENGVSSMKQFVKSNGIYGLVVGVTTGNATEKTLYEAGADIVLPTIGEFPRYISGKQI